MTDKELLTLASKAAGIQLAVDMTELLPGQYAFHSNGTRHRESSGRDREEHEMTAQEAFKKWFEDYHGYPIPRGLETVEVSHDKATFLAGWLAALDEIKANHWTGVYDCEKRIYWLPEDA